MRGGACVALSRHLQALLFRLDPVGASRSGTARSNARPALPGTHGSCSAVAAPARRAPARNGCAPRRSATAARRPPLAPHRPRRRDDRPGAQRDDRRRVGPAVGAIRPTSAPSSRSPRTSSSGPTAPSRRCSPPTIPTACAGPSSTPPGATSCAKWRRAGRTPGTCCSSRCVSARWPQMRGHHHAARRSRC